MNYFDVLAIKKERQILKRLRNFFTLGKCKQNDIVKIDHKRIYFKTSNSKMTNTITREKFRMAIREFYYKKTITRKDVEQYSSFSSALISLLRLVFTEITKVVKANSGLIRLTLKGVRYFFSGCDKSVRDLEVAVNNGANFVLMSYFSLRDSKSNRWKEHIKRLGIKVLLDSGAFSLWQAKEKGKEVKPIQVKDYADFIESHKDVLYGWISLDVVGNPTLSEENYNYLVQRDLKPIPVWHGQSEISELEKMIKEDHSLIAIGGTAKMSDKEKKPIFEKIFKLFPEQNFHALGLGSSYLIKYDWFSADATSWLSGRKYNKIINQELLTEYRPELDPIEAMAQNVRQYVKLEKEVIVNDLVEKNILLESA